MDEIKETPQDVPEKAPSEETSETTPAQAETKYSKEEVEKLINDRLSAVGRDAKSLSEKEQSLANQEKQLQQLRVYQRKNRVLQTKKSSFSNFKRLSRSGIWKPR